MTALPVRLLLAVASGLVAALSFEPYGWAYLLPVAVAGVTISVVGLRSGRAFLLGTAFGLAFMLLLLPWLRVIGTDAWILLSLLEALFYGVGGLASAAVVRLRFWPVWVATVWVGVEMLRGTIPFGGFPWGRLSFATVDTVVASGFAYVGAAGVTFLVALVGTTLAWAALNVRDNASGALAGAAVAFALAAAPSVSPVNQVDPDTAPKPIDVAAVQGNVPGEGLDAFAERRAVLDLHVEATLEYARRMNPRSRPDLVIWPESSTDIDPFSDQTVYDDIQEAVDAVFAPVLVGAMVGGEEPDEVYNQGIVWRPVSGPVERYSKRHPVPFGEYIPFRDQLEPYIERLEMIPRDMVPGDEPGVLEMGGIQIGAVICFEIAYDGVVRDAVPSGTRALVVQTNNATYMGTGQVEQQFAIARLRAIETGRPVIVAATNGVSGIIEPDGSVRDRALVRSQTVLTETVLGPAERPLGLRVGPWVELALAAVALVAAGCGLVLGRRRRAEPAVDDADRVEVDA